MAKRLITGEILNGISTFKNGSGIHIKEKNKGLFTKYCNGKVTQACIDKAKRSGNKKLIKRAVFAENSRKWAKKHQEGGLFTKLGNAIIKGMNNSGNYMVVPEKEAGTLAKKIYNSVNPVLPYPDGMDKAIGLGIASLFAEKNKMQYEVTDSTAQAAWAKRLGIPYNNKHLPSNGDGTVRLPKSIESEIPVDTTFWKQRIKDNENLLKFYEARGTSKHSDRYSIVDETLKNDRKTLQALRHTYKTGEPVVINENTFNSRQLVNRGEYDVDTTPLNVLHNYTIQYDPKNNVMHYRDTYDFNQFEWGVPGIPFNIRGTIKLKNKK